MTEDSRNNSSIEQILRRYSNIFLDTNVFINALGHFDKSRKEDLLQASLVTEKLHDFWIPLVLENSQIYLTQNIFGELKRDHYNYKKELKKHRSFAKEHMEVMRIKRKLKNKRNSFLDEFPSERIVDANTLENRAIYDELYEKYNIYAKSSQSFNGIGKEDLDLLLLAGVFSKIRGKTCLISNDFGILRCYKHFLNSERLSKDNYGFYFQQELNSFKKV
jgi:hypothetical protein